MTTDIEGRLEFKCTGFILKSNPVIIITTKQKYMPVPNNRNKSILYR